MTKRTRRGDNGLQGRARAPRESEDFAELPFGYMVRSGREIAVQGTLSAEEHSALVDAFIEQGVQIKNEQQTRRNRLLEIFEEVDPVDLLARASLTYLHLDPDTFKETESDRSPAHVEYLALQALGRGLPGPKEVDPLRATVLTTEAIEVAREMFRAASMLMTIEAASAHRDDPDDPDDPMIEYQLKSRLQSLGVRGTGYVEHLTRVLHGCLDPFEEQCRELLGFTATDALALTYGMASLISARMEPLWSAADAGRVEMLRQLKHERRHRSSEGRVFPDWLLDLPPNEGKRHLSAFAATYVFADSRSLVVVTAEDLAAHCAISTATARAFLEGFACAPELFDEQHHAFPGGAHPLTVQPVLRLDDGYVAPVGSSLFDALRPRMEDLLHRTPVWERYADARAKYVERDATDLIASALPGSRSWTAISWRSSDANSDLDGLVTADDFTARVQCKAGRLTAPARRGAPSSMKRDISELIQAAADQHAILATALESELATEIGFSKEQAAAFDARLQLEVIVCLDDVTVWATETHELRKLGALPHDRPIPWVLSLTDLMAVVDLLQGAQFAHYLLRRLRIERDGRIEAHDELDWVGHYISEGLFFDRFFETEHPPHAFRLLSYTDAIDAWYFTRDGVRSVDAPKPTQEIPRNLEMILQRLERERPRHWIVCAAAFLDGDQESRDLWDNVIVHAQERIPLTGWSNGSQTFNGRLGLTLFVDKRTDWPEMRARVADYCRTKAEQQDQPNWIGLGEGATGGLFVILVEREVQLPLAQLFLDPPPSRPDAMLSAVHSTSDAPLPSEEQ